MYAHTSCERLLVNANENTKHNHQQLMRDRIFYHINPVCPYWTRSISHHSGVLSWTLLGGYGDSEQKNIYRVSHLNIWNERFRTICSSPVVSTLLTYELQTDTGLTWEAHYTYTKLYHTKLYYTNLVFSSATSYNLLPAWRETWPTPVKMKNRTMTATNHQRRNQLHSSIQIDRNVSQV